GIHWTGPESAPEPVAQGEIMRGSRAQNLRMNLKSPADQEYKKQAAFGSLADESKQKAQEDVAQQQVQQRMQQQAAPALKESDVPVTTAEGSKQQQESPLASATPPPAPTAPGAAAAAAPAETASREPSRASKSAAGKLAYNDAPATTVTNDVGAGVQTAP